MWSLEVFETDDGVQPYARFIDSLPDFKFAALDAAVERVLAARGMDLVRTEWLKPLGGGLHEFRVRHTADEILRMFGTDSVGATGPRERVLLRVFVHFHGDKVVLLLVGYDKGIRPGERRQQREINTARKLLAQFKQRPRRHKRRGP